MSTVSVYRSMAPSVLAVWHEAEEQDRIYHERLTSAMAEIDPTGRRNPVVSRWGWVGIQRIPDEAIPDGWRLHDWYLVPRRSTKAGKRFAKLIDECRAPRVRDKLPGMPGMAVIGSHMLQPGVKQHSDGWVYVTWAADVSAQPIDLEIWEPVRLSAYYALTESEDGGEAAS